MFDKIATPIRILIVDDHRIVRQGIRMLLEVRDDMQISGEAGNRQEALSLASREQPDIILLDLDLGGVNGLDFLPELRNTARSARIIILTGVRDPDQHRRAISLGAVGLVMKDQAADVLIRAIARVHSGEAWLDRTITASVISGLSRPKQDDEEGDKIASLTEREREIISVACQGYKNSQIATQLFISEATVRNHMTSILNKLGLSDRFELAIYSYRHGLARPPDLQPVEKK